MFIQGAAQLLGEDFKKYVDLGDYLKRRATSLGIDTEGLIKDEEQIAEEEQQAQAQMMAQQVAPNVANAAGKMAQEDPEKLQAMAQAAAQGME